MEFEFLAAQAYRTHIGVARNFVFGDLTTDSECVVGRVLGGDVLLPSRLKV